MNKTLLVVSTVLVTACASTPQPQPQPQEKVAPAAAVPVAANPVVAPAKATPDAPAPVVAVAEIPKSQPIAPFQQSVWKLKKGKMIGGQPAPKILSQIKNQKTPGTTTEKCYHYQKFAVVEMKSTDEVGAAEIAVRTPSDEHKNLCAKEFKGPSKDLRIIEGHFAGVINGHVLVDGEDASEGTLEFQIFNLEGREIFKSVRHPEEEFTIVGGSDGKTSLTFFAKISVRCELAAEGEECWKKTVVANQLPKTPMPDCKAAFEKAKMQMSEPALVTVRAQVSDLSQPKVKLLGGKATCVPAP